MKEYRKRTSVYIDHLNAHVLPNVDFKRLAASYDSEDKDCMKQVLAELHRAYINVYDANIANTQVCEEIVLLPAVIRAQKTGKLCIGMVVLDLASSGEHWGTDFFTEDGVIPDVGDLHLSQKAVKDFVPYDYWYTVNVERDHHVDFSMVPPDVSGVLDFVEESETAQTPQQKKKSKCKKDLER